MSNMSYCRFQNTLSDLLDCKDALEEVLAGSEKLSPEELRAAKQLIETCLDIAGAVAEGAATTVEELLDGDTHKQVAQLLDFVSKGQ